MESREFIILIFVQGLLIGKKTEKTLINPHQGQDFGIPICDDPTNQNRPMGIEADFNTHIPMSMVGYTCEFITPYTTDDNIETCRHIIISNGHNWDP